MDRARPKFIERLQVRFGAITFVTFESIVGITLGVGGHLPVSADFGQHAGSGNAARAAVPADDRHLVDSREVRDSIPTVDDQAKF